MCGIAGIYSAVGANIDLRESALKMTETFNHRGPDDEGVWTDLRGRIALGHCRLSVVDLSPSGHQPMHSACGRYVLTFNGEIYNHADIRSDLESTTGVDPAKWRGHSDTEVALEAIATWGLRDALEQFNGMFAFALWDQGNRELHLVRDRVGEKPLYYGWMGESFVFASELRAFREVLGPQPEIDRERLAEFLDYGYIAAPWTILEGIRKLLPGSVLTLSTPATAGQELPVEAYWSIEAAEERAMASPFTCDPESAVDELEVLLRDSVGMRTAADVPLGAFLSGGIDSSLIVALMQTQSDRPVNTFSIGFQDPAYDEANFAAKVAEHLGTHHREMYVTADDALAVVPKLGEIFDEPFGDSSQIPTWLLASLTRGHVTVALSGDGGDELFGGYSRYRATENLWKSVSWMPSAARRATGAALSNLPISVLDRLFAGATPLLNRYSRPGGVGDKVRKLGNVVGANSPDHLYDAISRSWLGTGPPVLGVDAASGTRSLRDWKTAGPSFLRRMMLTDLSCYLPDDILTKVDRTTMNVSLEARVPLLDHRIVEFALRLPDEIHRRDGEGKWPLRQLLGRYLPQELFDRPKRGFGVPLGEWLRGPLRPWAEELLDERRLEREGYLDPVPIRHRWSEHISGIRNWQHSLWNVLMFQSWLATTASARIEHSGAEN